MYNGVLPAVTFYSKCSVGKIVETRRLLRSPIQRRFPGERSFYSAQSYGFTRQVERAVFNFLKFKNLEQIRAHVETLWRILNKDSMGVASGHRIALEIEIARTSFSPEKEILLAKGSHIYRRSKNVSKMDLSCTFRTKRLNAQTQFRRLYVIFHQTHNVKSTALKR